MVVSDDRRRRNTDLNRIKSRLKDQENYIKMILLRLSEFEKKVR